MIRDADERDRLLMGDAVFAELKQFDKLRQLDPPISAKDLAFRMAWSLKQTRWLLTKMGDKRP
jgi:hypothetical protein